MAAPYTVPKTGKVITIKGCRYKRADSSGMYGSAWFWGGVLICDPCMASGLSGIWAMGDATDIQDPSPCFDFGLAPDDQLTCHNCGQKMVVVDS
jgi:hypothetical protein